MFFLQNIRERKIRPKLLNEKKFYNSKHKNEIMNYQLNKFNELWESIQLHVNFYRKLVEQKQLPKQFDNFKHCEEVPIITRDYASESMVNFINNEIKPDSWGTTGRSTENSLQFRI